MKREKVFRTIKRVMAILGIILIVLMYAATFIAAVFVKKYTVRLFLASLIMTMVVPLLLYAYQMTMKIFLHLNDPDPELPSDNQKGFAEAADINQAHSSQSK